MQSKGLSLVLTILVAAFIFSLGMEYKKYGEESNTTANRQLLSIGDAELSCEKDSDCTLSQTKCCRDCSYGTPVNLRADKRLKTERASNCTGVVCPATPCFPNSCINDAMTEPKPACVNRKCTVLSSPLDCNKVCSSMSLDETEIQALGCNPKTSTFELLALKCSCMSR